MIEAVKKSEEIDERRDIHASVDRFLFDLYVA
jgi:hypothetical protein